MIDCNQLLIIKIYWGKKKISSRLDCRQETRVVERPGQEVGIVLNIGDDKWEGKQAEWSDKQLTKVITRENTSQCFPAGQRSLIKTGMSTLQLWRPQSGFCLQLPQLMTSSPLNGGT